MTPTREPPAWSMVISVVTGERRASRQAAAGGAVRRGACVAIVLVAHGLLLWALSLGRVDPASLPSASALIELDLSPMPEAATPLTDAAPTPATPSTLPPAAPSESAAPEPAASEPAIPKPAAPAAEPMPAPATLPTAVLPEPAPAPAAPAKPIATKPAARPAPPSTPPSKPRSADQAPATASHRPQASAPPLAPAPAAPPAAAASTPAAPSPPAVQGDPNAVPAWQGRLAGQLQRAKRYPDTARSAGEEGSAAVSFTIDRNGQLLAARLVRSSGSPALDEEAVALVHRAEPLPPPPAELAGRTITLTVPIRFTLR